MRDNPVKAPRDPAIYCAQGPHRLEPTGSGELSESRFVFKDLFDVAGFKTGAGNPQWLATHDRAEHSSPLVSRLLAAGAECVGRVQTDELAYSLNGQNIHYGTPVNPLAPSCLPGGSSSGSAVAVAWGDADFAIGTDTGGSVRVPASYCGLYGLRPTLGRLSLEHCFELSKSFDTAGLFSAQLPLLARAFSVLADDRPSSPVEPTYTLWLDPALERILGPARQMQLADCCQRAGIKLTALALLDELGATLAKLSLLFRTIQGFEIIQTHGNWLAEYGQSLAPAIAERVSWARTITHNQYQQAQGEQQSLRQRLLALLSQQPGCLFALPTTPGGPPRLDTPAEQLAEYRSELMGLTSIAGLAGLPQLHLPMTGLSQGPCGISLLGLPNTEPQLFAAANQLTQEAL